MATPPSESSCFVHFFRGKLCQISAVVVVVFYHCPVSCYSGWDLDTPLTYKICGNATLKGRHVLSVSHEPRPVLRTTILLFSGVMVYDSN